MTTATTDTSWADPLTLTERYAVARLLARACKRFWQAAEPGRWNAQSGEENARAQASLMASHEMAELHLDVTERAKVV